MDGENPQGIQELSRARYEQALDHVEAVLRRNAHDDPDVFNEMRIIRLVGCNRVPWWGMAIDPEDSSVHVGVMMRNAFESVGDWIDDPGPRTRPANWFTRRYLPLWRQGKREHLEWLDALGHDRPPDAGQ